MHTRIVEVIEENPDVKTFRFRFGKVVQAGQFCMVWDGNGEEVPMSFSYTAGLKGITVRRVGHTTALLHNLKEGATLRLRGPLGNGYPVQSMKYLIVAGGTGIASLAPAAEAIAHAGGEFVFLAGFRTAREIFFIDRLKKLGTVLLATDDGTAGYRGVVTGLVEKVLAEQEFDACLTCGPEIMMQRVSALTGDIPTYCSLERLMKCGIGICDACSVGGLQVCKDGPVFRAEMLRNLGVWA